MKRIKQALMGSALVTFGLVAAPTVADAAHRVPHPKRF